MLWATNATWSRRCSSSSKRPCRSSAFGSMSANPQIRRPPKRGLTLSTDEAAALSSLYQHMRVELKLSADEARARLMVLEPFAAYPDAIRKLPDVVEP